MYFLAAFTFHVADCQEALMHVVGVRYRDLRDLLFPDDVVHM